MKMILFFTTLFSISAHATDKMNDTILCGPRTGQGIYVAVQENAMAWVKRISIRVSPDQDGEIGNYTVPVDQPRISTPGWDSSTRTAYFEAEGLELSMSVAGVHGENVSGDGHIVASLPHLLKPIDADLNCERTR